MIVHKIPSSVLAEERTRRKEQVLRDVERRCASRMLRSDNGITMLFVLWMVIPDVRDEPSTGVASKPPPPPPQRHNSPMA
ncbi:hypothetical protein F5Y07DRAFT_400460 [Xylaria sp. FL0933]|nr:hypothetical protein F5Y07DRAFT_400460 [Xylaria sp. FL0933]